MAVQREVRMPESKGKRLRHLQVEKGEDGGHVVTHHYTDDGMMFHKPKVHVFGKNEGEQTMAHIAHHMQIQPSEEGGAEEAGESPELEAKEQRTGKEY